MKSITYFTPTYNRAYCLSRLYEAFKRQTNKDLIWLIVDDGSSDDTEKLVASWMENEKSFEIQYIKKENGGLHTGYNTAIDRIRTPLASCLDTSGWLFDDANERTLELWSHSNDAFSGILGYCVLSNGDSLGSRFNAKSINLYDYFTGRMGINCGDMQIVLRADLYKSVAPQQTYSNEKNFNPIYMILKAVKNNPMFLVLDEPIAYAEYQPGGLTLTGPYIAYWNNPQSFSELRRLFMCLPNAPIKYVFRQCIHYVSTSIRGKKFDFIKKSPKPFITILAIPFGIVLYFITFIKQRNRDL